MGNRVYGRIEEFTFSREASPLDCWALLADGVMAAQGSLKPLVMVRIHVGQPIPSASPHRSRSKESGLEVFCPSFPGSSRNSPMDIAGVYRLLDACSGLSPQGNPAEPDSLGALDRARLIVAP